MDRITMLMQAEQCISSLDRNDIKESVFGVLRNLIECQTDHAPIEKNQPYDWSIFSYVLKLNDNKEKNRQYMGIKLAQLIKAIKVLYSFDEKKSHEQTFKDYTLSDVIAYTEICRRLHKVKEKINHPRNYKDSQRKIGLNMIQIKTGLAEGKLDIASYVIENESQYDKRTILDAKKIIGRNKK